MLEFRVLGPLEVLREGRSLVLGRRHERALLALLVLSANRIVSSERLIEDLWGGAPPDTAASALRVYVSRLRRVLGEGGAGNVLVTRPPGYVLRVENDAVDAVRFEAFLARGRELAAAGEYAGASEVFRQALGLWRGEALADVADAPFARAEAARLEEARLAALEARIEADLACGNHRLLVGELESLTRDHPLRERLWALRMLALYRSGRQADALRAYQEVRSLLGEELGLEPGDALRRLESAILRQEPDLDWRPGGPEELRQGRLDGLAVPEGLPGPPSRLGLRWEGTGLPMATTSFVGREEAVTDVAGAVRRSRLVTLTGTGGVGKSRLALETAHRLAGEHPDGGWLCELAHVADPGGVAFALAAAVGVRQVQGATIEDSLVEALAARDVLVVVDNCEHVLEGVVPLFERILHRCPGVHILATSRERLAADGETVVEVPPLELPEEQADATTAWERPAPALELLQDRIAAVRPGFHPDVRHRVAIVEIARRLEGLPLALELAATRVAAMGPVEVAGRLDQRFALLTRGRRTALPRHRTLRAAIEWSYGLLDDRERRAFERAAVFVGGFTLDAAEDVFAAAGGGRGEDVADIVGALVDKSMLVVDDRGPTTRYRMLETLRQFGQEQLATHGELAPTERAHALYYTGLAWRAESRLRGQDEAEWLSIMDAEIANLRAAHAWALRSGNRGLATELSAALLWFAYWRMHTDVLAWADQLSDDEPADAGPHLARALAAAGAGAWMRGELARARTLGERAIACPGAETEARYGWHPVLGPVALFEGRLDDACAAFRRAGELARRDGDQYHAANSLGTVAVVQSYAGDAAGAIATAEASRLEAACSGSPTALAWSAYASGEVLTGTEPDAALLYLDRAVELADTVAAHFIHGVALLSATSLRARHGDSATAARALIDIIDRWKQAGNWRQQWTTLRHAVELFARVGNEKAAATVLGAIDANDAASLFGADAERLSLLRADLVARLGVAAEERMAEGRAMKPAEVVTLCQVELDPVAASAERSAPEHGLTRRELEVLRLLARARTNQEIAAELHVSLKTVKTHVSNILAKLGATDRTQAAVLALDSELIERRDQ